MPDGTTSRDRLTELIELARTYRGWTRRKLAKSLGRDASKLVPESGLPKIDLVIELARVLDWPVQDVVNSLGEDPIRALVGPNADESRTYEQLNAESYKAYTEGCFVEMIELAQRAYRAATTSTERARACNRESGGWDGLGHYRKALEAIQRGLHETDAEPARILLLRSNLANTYYALWHLVEAKGVALDVLSNLEEAPPSTVTERIAQAMAFYVRGHCHRRQIRIGHSSLAVVATKCRNDLLRSAELYEALSEELGGSAHAGIANTCRGGVMEADVALGLRSAHSAVEEVLSALDEAEQRNPPLRGDWLESYSWWCIFACNVVMRHIEEPSFVQRTMAVLTGKADEFAADLGNWALRERVLTMDFVRRQHLDKLAGTPIEWTIDSEDMRGIAGAMGRFPSFRQTGWQILRSATKVQGS